MAVWHRLRAEAPIASLRVPGRSSEPSGEPIMRSIDIQNPCSAGVPPRQRRGGSLQKAPRPTTIPTFRARGICFRLHEGRTDDTRHALRRLLLFRSTSSLRCSPTTPMSPPQTVRIQMTWSPDGFGGEARGSMIRARRPRPVPARSGGRRRALFSDVPALVRPFVTRTAGLSQIPRNRVGLQERPQRKRDISGPSPEARSPTKCL